MYGARLGDGQFLGTLCMPTTGAMNGGPYDTLHANDGRHTCGPYDTIKGDDHGATTRCLRSSGYLRTAE